MNVSTDKIIKILKEIHNLGGCDATDDYSKGWDDAIDAVLDKIEEIADIPNNSWLD